MSGLPKGWTEFRLADVGGLVGGKTPNKGVSEYWTGGRISWASPKDMKSFKLEQTEDHISEKAINGAGLEVLPRNTVLMVTRSGILSHTFPVAILTIPSAINQDLKALRPSDAVIPMYAAYLFRAFGLEILKSCSKAGTTVAR